MIKIEESGYNKPNYGVSRQFTGNCAVHSQPSFTGKVPQIPTTSLRDAIEYVLPSSTKMLKVLGSNGGEIQNIIINAVGTGLVAPIFIKYNFLSEADQDTRTYSAWRQPVSAVLAVLTQAGFTAPFYKIFDNWANNGTFGEALNKTPFQDEYYLKKLIKRKYPNATDKQIVDMVKNIQEEQRSSMLRTLEDKNTVIYTLKNGSKLKISDGMFRNILIETVNKLAKHDKASLEKIEETIAMRTNRGIYYSKYYNQAKDFLNEFYNQISEAQSYKDINTYMSKKLSELKANKSPKEMLSIIEEVRRRAKVVSNGREVISFSNIQQALLEKVKKMQAHANEYSVLNSDAEVRGYVENLVHSEKSKLESAMEFYNLLKTQISEQSNVREIRQKIEAECKKLKIENSGLNENFTEEVANQLISRTKTNMKWYKQFVGIFVSLSILPFTCTLLNWIYPRFMDAFFPNLSSKKHGKESAKLIEKAPKYNSIEKIQLNKSASVTFGDVTLNSFKAKKAEVHNG